MSQNLSLFDLSIAVIFSEVSMRIFVRGDIVCFSMFLCQASYHRKYKVVELTARAVILRLPKDLKKISTQN